MKRAQKRRLGLVQCLIDAVKELAAERAPSDLLIHTATNEVHKRSLNTGMPEATRRELLSLLRRPLGEVLLDQEAADLEHRVENVQRLQDEEMRRVYSKRFRVGQ